MAHGLLKRMVPQIWTFLREYVYMGDLEISGIGAVKRKMFDGTVHTIKEIRHVKGMKKNLLCLERIECLGRKAHMKNRIMKIVKGAFLLMKVEKIGVNSIHT